MEFTIKTSDAMDVVRSGATVQLRFDKLGDSIVQDLLNHGIAAKVGDAAASASAIAGESHFGKVKKEVNKADWKAWQDSAKGQEEIAAIALSAMEGVVEALYAGSWSQSRSGGPRIARLPDDMTIAVKSAKQDLLIMFKRVTGKAKLAEMAVHEKIAPFFQPAGDGVAWDDAKVVLWVEKQASDGKRDYLAEAKASLAVDVSDLEL